MATARKARVTTRRQRTSAHGDGPRAPMYLVHMVQVRVLKQVDEFIDRVMRALEPELRKRFLHLDADKPRSPITLARKTLKSLGQIDDTFRPETLKGLRASEEFRATGRTSKAFDRVEHEVGIKVAIERDGNLVLRSGSHRFKVAKELGLDSIWGTVVDAENGRVLFVGNIPLKASAQEAAPALPASISALFETGPIPVSAEWLRATFRVIDHQAGTDLSRVIGVPTRDVLPNAHELERKWVRANTDLIKLPEKARREVEAIVTDQIKQGRRVEEIRKEIQERLGVSRSRAETNARSQTLRTYGQIQEERQRAAGITAYVWSTSEDERVRPDHAELDGTTQRWDSPPVVDKRTGRREHPGFDHNCRCAAVPVLDD